jgi:hypothetical protein
VSDCVTVREVYRVLQSDGFARLITLKDGQGGDRKHSYVTGYCNNG